MTRFVHDQFAKEYLEELLSNLGEVKAPREVRGQLRQIDVWFAPASEQKSNPEILGLLGSLAATPSLFEPFRNLVTQNEICNCLLKLLEVRGEVQREANRNNTRISEDDFPKLWILTPTASDAILDSFRAIADRENWLPGIYFLAPALRTAIVVIHQLPRTTETLWLRILGRGKVQEQAIDELEALPVDNPFRSNALLLLSNLRSNLEVNPDVEQEDRQLIMRLSPLFSQQLESATQTGMQEGMRTERRTLVENFLTVRFGSLDEELAAIIQPMLELPTDEFTRLILQLSNLSREDLLARFGNRN